MDNILYYPYINLPRTDWTLRTLLYYDTIGSIVPQEYFYNPDRNYDPFMLDLVQKKLVIPVNPIEVINPLEFSKAFLSYLKQHKNSFLRSNSHLDNRQNSRPTQRFFPSKLHADKFDGEIFYALQDLGLAQRLSPDDSWYLVESKTANLLMKLLAMTISKELEMLPTTDVVNVTGLMTSKMNQNRKRGTILKELIPFPENIDLAKVRAFKDKHPDLLKSFKNKVELITLNPQYVEGTELFSETLKELKFRKEELSAKMNESQMGNIFYGTVCGLLSSGISMVTVENKFLAIAAATPGFLNGIHASSKVEKPENIFDQSGMKYLALVDKRLTIRRA